MTDDTVYDKNQIPINIGDRVKFKKSENKYGHGPSGEGEVYNVTIFGIYIRTKEEIPTQTRQGTLDYSKSVFVTADYNYKVQKRMVCSWVGELWTRGINAHRDTLALQEPNHWVEVIEVCDNCKTTEIVFEKTSGEDKRDEYNNCTKCESHICDTCTRWTEDTDALCKPKCNLPCHITLYLTQIQMIAI